VTSIYGSYSKSFLPQYSNLPGAGGPFDPETGRQFELGTRNEWFGGRLVGTATVYHIRKTNVLNPDPVDPIRQVQSGEVTSKGFETEITGRATRSLSILANYAFNDAAVTKDTSGLQGSKLPNAPKHQGGFWARQEVGRHFAVALGLRSVSLTETPSIRRSEYRDIQC
jgi:iron complex outermembrane recepter protein